MPDQKIPRARTKKNYRDTPAPQKKKAPWEQDSPVKSKGGKSKMTQEQKDEARARAEKAGRPYPNLIDNMAVMKEARQKADRNAKDI